MKSSVQHELRHNERSRKGAAVVEFAIVVPIALVIVFAGMEFAGLFIIRNTVHNAAYEAARAAIIPGAKSEDARSQAESVMAALGVRNLTVVVDPPMISNDTRNVTVEVAVPWSENAIMLPMFTGGVTIRSRITMRTERYFGVGGT